ncbi:universal stress protein [Cupriavidus pinatubonensis]|uniref:universal stress protein n=1 Tax=Cupriavidus pinatubonensis TaxID=248026 RepID=UPI001128E1EF|nr:universal stress protein [Cupriavidus pinatubonensis]QYY33358.1 universal stress protein [Cupriavidus pinatubonensis]TPQ25105.1 universal stress protein [Cupriavidus pinatubonensis]
MQNIVLATDGSAYSDAAARCIAERKLFRDDICVHVVHCLPDVSGEVKAYINRQDIEAWHTDESSKVMKSAIDILQGANVQTLWHALVGFAPERIVAYATAVKAEAIVMGTHGRGAFLDAIVGSVASRVIAHAACPVVLVRALRRQE